MATSWITRRHQIANLRRHLARRIWDLADWIYADDHSQDQIAGEQPSHTIEIYFEASAQDADQVYDRVTNAICGVEHHALDPCPGPAFVASMKSSTSDADKPGDEDGDARRDS